MTRQMQALEDIWNYFTPVEKERFQEQYDIIRAALKKFQLAENCGMKFKGKTDD